MNDDFRYMKFIYWHCGEEMNLFGPNMLAQLEDRLNLFTHRSANI